MHERESSTQENSWSRRQAEAFRAAGPSPPCPEGVCVCPICGFYSADVRDFTREHVPAECVQGKELVLTCARCNHRSGAELTLTFGSSETLKSSLRAG